MKHRQAYFSSDFQTREADQEQAPVIEGYFAVFNQPTELWAELVEEIAPGAFDKSLAANDIRCLFNHETGFCLGRSGNHTLKLSVDEKGLYGIIAINREDKAAMDVYARVKRRDIIGCSFGFDIKEGDEELIDLGNRQYKSIIRNMDLLEVSICTFPAYPQTEIEARSRELKRQNEKQLELRKKTLKERITQWQLDK